MAGTRRGQHLGQGRVAIVVALEVEQRVDQRPPLAFGDADREEEEDREVGRSPPRRPGGGDRPSERRPGSPAVEHPVGHARASPPNLDRVQHTVAVLEIARSRASPRPGAAPSTRGRWHSDLRGRVFEPDPLAALAVLHRVRVPGIEEPVLPGRNSCARGPPPAGGPRLRR